MKTGRLLYSGMIAVAMAVILAPVPIGAQCTTKCRGADRQR